MFFVHKNRYKEFTFLSFSLALAFFLNACATTQGGIEGLVLKENIQAAATPASETEVDHKDVHNAEPIVQTASPDQSIQDPLPPAEQTATNAQQQSEEGRTQSSERPPQNDLVIATVDPTANIGAWPAIETQQPLAQEQDTPAPTTVTEAPPPELDLWQRMRQNYALGEYEQRRVNNELRWYVEHPEYIARTFERGRPYLHYIVEEVERRSMPMEIALLPVVESAFQPFAYSHGRASGIWQFIPGTGRHMGLKINWWYDGRRDIKRATHAALDYLERLNKMFDGDWLLALAAYNSGGGTVKKAVRKNKRKERPTDFWHLHLPLETRNYVPRLIAIARLVKNPGDYDISLPEMPNEAFFTTIELDSQIDLSLVAELAGLSMDELYRLNPGFNRWTTPPDGPHEIVLPLEKEADFVAALESHPKEKRINWLRHKIRQGDSLSTIAVRYNTTVGVLKKANKLSSTRIRAGKHLLVPVAHKKLASYTLSEDQRKLKKVTPKGDVTRVVHVVEPGDTFWDIARANRVGVRSLAKWNNMAPGDILRPGQELLVWVDKNHVKEEDLIESAPIDQLQRPVQKITYRVRRGDSLARISQKFNVSLAQIKRWNKGLNNRKYIQPGEHVTLFVDITNVGGDS